MQMNTRFMVFLLVCIRLLCKEKDSFVLVPGWQSNLPDEKLLCPAGLYINPVKQTVK